ncbi:MAG: DUF4037 domain-containing protein [Promethearchaeota archaeon]
MDAGDYDELASQIRSTLSESLPVMFLGYPTNWTPPDPDDSNNQFLAPVESGPVNHRVEVHTVRGYLEEKLCLPRAVDLEAMPVEDWLCLPEQLLLEFTSGRVFRDDLGDLTRARQSLEYFPRPVWLFKTYSQWEKISQGLALPGRAGMTGDDLGSRVEAARLARLLMELAFIMERPSTSPGSCPPFWRASSRPGLGKNGRGTSVRRVSC